MDRSNKLKDSFLQFFHDLFDLMVVNWLWLLCSLPIVTVGPATCGLYRVTLKLARQEPVQPLRDFFRGFRENFKSGLFLGLWAILLLVAGVMAIAGALLMQEWQIRQDAQEYEQLVMAVKATERPLAECQVPKDEVAADPVKETQTQPPFVTAPPPVHSKQEIAETPAITPSATPMPETEATSTSSVPSETVIDLAALKTVNSDFVAWLHIPGTKIDYPVVLTDDVEYYLTHSFSGKESICGTLFSLSRTDYRTPSRNIAIFGHHMRRSRSQTMFQPLHNYKDSSFYHKHSTITLDSLYRSETYRIFAVLNMCESDWNASTADFSTDEAFLSFVERAKALSFYDTGVSVSPDDHILTLITCDRDYHSTEGRLIVMAVQQ